MLLIGLAVLGTLSAVPALVPGVWGIVVGRGLMGVGAALILPATLALIPPQFRPSEQACAFAAWMIVALVGQAAGPAIGGILTQALGWRWVFWINLPLAAIAFLVVRSITPESLDPNAFRSIDFVGLVTSAGAVFALLYGLTAGQDVGFTDPLIIGMFAAAILLAVAFVVFELRISNPLVDLNLFKVRPFDGALIANLSMNLVFGGVSFVLVLYLEEVRGYGPIQAGLLLLPSTATILLMTPFGARAVLRVGARLPMLIGTMVMGCGCIILGSFRRRRASGYRSPGNGLWNRLPVDANRQHRGGRRRGEARRYRFRSVQDDQHDRRSGGSIPPHDLPTRFRNQRSDPALKNCGPIPLADKAAPGRPR
jgi:MFS family permease